MAVERAKTLAPRARRVVAIGAVCGLAILLIAGAAILHLRRVADADAMEETRQLSHLLAGYVARSFQAVDLVLRDLAEDVEREGIADAAGLRSAFGDQAGHLALRRRIANLPQIDSLGLSDAAGNMVGTSRIWPAPPLSIANRSFFREHRDANSRSLFISERIDNRMGGGRTVILTRRVDAPDGRQLGVVAAAIRLAHLDDFFASTGFSPGTGLVLARGDGTVLKRHPVDDLAPAERLSAPVLAALPIAEGAPFRIEGVPDQRGPRLAHLQRVPGFDLYFGASRLESEALARWRDQVAGILAAAAAMLLCVAALVRSLLRQFRDMAQSHARIAAHAAAVAGSEARLARHSAALRVGEARLSAQSVVLRTTLEHIDQGLIMVDGDGRVAVWNRRAAALLGLPESLLEGRPHFAEVAAHQRAAGEFAHLAEAEREAVDRDEPPLHEEVYERRRPDGTVLEIRSTPLADGGMVRTYTDVTARAEAEEMLALAASRDPLTGLANRNGFARRLDLALAAAQRAGTGLAVLCLDLDGFKAVNDTHGHEAGDTLLQRVADRLRPALREADIVARLGGDEFAVVLPEVEARTAGQVAQRLVGELRLPYLVDGTAVTVGVSIGLAMFPQDGGGAEQLLRQADAALYEAKRGGRNTWRAHAAEAGARERERQAMAEELGRAIAADGLTLLYQPICDAAGGGVTGFEALLRWTHPLRGPIAPAEFLPLAEQHGLILPLGRWVIAAACAEAAAWPAPARVAVNLSPSQFRDPALLGTIDQALARSGLAPQRLELELTEELLREEPGQVLAVMQALRARGVRLGLDDYGTTKAQAGHVSGFPFDSVKIDRSLLRALSSDRQARSLVESMLAAARSQGLAVVGEGVETPEQLALLRHLRCDRVQGYLIGRPDTGAAARARLAGNAAAALAAAG